MVKTPNGRVVSKSHRTLKNTRNCTVSATDFTTTQSEMEPRPSSPIPDSTFFKTSCIIVSPSTPDKLQTVKNTKNNHNELIENHIYDNEGVPHDCKLHGYQYSTLQKPRRSSPRGLLAKNRHFSHKNNVSNLSTRSISSQTLYRPKNTFNRQKTTYHCHHADSSAHTSPKVNLIPPPPPPPRSMKCNMKLRKGDNDNTSFRAIYVDEPQDSDENEDTTSEYDEEDIEVNDEGSQRSTPEIQESSLYNNSKNHMCCKDGGKEDNVHQIASVNNPSVNTQGISRNGNSPESCLTCINPNHYHHYHHQVGNFIAPITLITTSGIPGEPPKHFFLRQTSTPYLNPNVKIPLDKTESDVEPHQHECKCGVTFQPPPPKSISLSRTLSNPTIVTVPQPHREAPQLNRYDKSSPQCIVSQNSFVRSHETPITLNNSNTCMQQVTSVLDINSDEENSDLGHKNNTDVVKENGRVISEYKVRKEVEYNRQNLSTSPSYVNENNKIELESEMICPPPPPVPYGTLRYNSFVNTGNQASNNIEKSTTR